MAATVKDLIEYLSGIPLDTELRVLRTYEKNYGVCTEYVPLDLNEITGNVEYTNMAGNQFVEKHSELWDRRFLDFGTVG